MQDRVRTISSQLKTGVHSKKVSVQIPAMMRTLSEGVSHSDAGVRSAAVHAFSVMASIYKSEMLGSDSLAPFNSALDDRSKFDSETFELLSDTLRNVLEPEYVSDEYLESAPRGRVYGMIIRLSSNRSKSGSQTINAAAVQMRMVMVAGVISASFKMELNDAAEDIDAPDAQVPKIFLTVKLPKEDNDRFIADLARGVVDGTEGVYKLGVVEFWESEKTSGKSSPLEKSTVFAESEIANDTDDGMYLDDDEKLASRATGKKRGPSRRPWSMFNPSSALGLSSVFNAGDLLEVVEYDEEEAKKATERSTTTGGFGLFRRLWG
jgi:hypothetical protein